MSLRRRRSSANEPGLKYASGVGARVPPEQRPLGPLAWITLAHVGVFLVGTTWAFGGGYESLRPILAWWGSLGLLITLTALQDHDAWRDGWMRPLIWLPPLIAFNVLVFAASHNPSFREVTFGPDIMLVNSGGHSGLPSSARPGDALRALWLFDAIWISAFNLALVIRQRRALRGLLAVAVVNAGALAVFGTVQKLSHAKGLFFGAVPSPQKAFFSSFIYHNHWGSFAVLMMAAGLGLVWHHARRRDTRDIYHSPAFAGLVVVLILAITVPLSTSRSCTLLTIGLLGGAFGHWIVRLVQKRRRSAESIAPTVVGACLALALAGAAVWHVASDTIMARIAKTHEQLEQFGVPGNVDSRGQLYRDTWRMARAKPWFGWGMASYPHVFTLYNTRESKLDRLPVFYRDAHSDWLQALAEHGFIGTALLGLCGLLPLLRLRARHFSSPLAAYLLAGCGLILLFAWIEFPFGNIAVVLTWWLCFFAAVQYARLQDREAPAPVKLVAPDAKNEGT